MRGKRVAASDERIEPCPVCGELASFKPKWGDYEQVSCPRCGNYEISETAIRTLETRTPEQRQARLEDAKRRALGIAVPYIGPNVT